VLVAAAVCPHPPLLVAAVGVGLGPEIDALRSECRAAVESVMTATVDRVYLVGAGIGPAATSFAPWAPGSDLEGLAVDVPEPLPLSLLVGAHLTRGTRRSFVVVDPATDADDCVELGRELAGTATRVALLVMGDGAARHDVKAPGFVDPRAGEFDRSVHEIFSIGDLAALVDIDAVLAQELLCAGRAPWQVLAGAADETPVNTEGALLSIPFGVGYHVACWRVQAGNEGPATKG
jgi:hypothetical protein